MLSWLWSKVQFYAAAAGTLIVLVALAFLRGKRAGKADTVSTLNKETQRNNEKFRQIDNERPDFNRAVSSLRDRSNGKTPK